MIVLCFFTWTFGGVFDIAYAIKNSDELRGASSEVKDQQQNTTQKPEEKFQKTIEDIEQILTDTSTDTDTKKSKVTGKKGELESLDIEMKKQFSATEKKLKDEGLPYEILERHYDFVKKYDNNLNELRNNLDAIDKAKDKKETDTAIEATKKFLEKVKPPKKHVPLDPNKLPHRTMEPVFTDPREKPEEFTKDSDQLSAFSTQHNKEIPSTPTFIKGGKGGLPNNEPILVASNGSLDGLLTPSSTFKSSPLPSVGEGKGEGVLLALANPPTTADLSETIEVKFTPAIQAKAAELGHNPTKIYNWVRNNIEYVPTYGSIQGADMCLQTKQCNDFDTASLLIALLRASGIHARYVYGTVEIPIDKVKNWLGGFTDSMAALNLLASARIPTKGMVEGGAVKYARIEHVWAEAWIDYIPSRGARHRTGQGDTWIPLDASFKQYTYTQGIDIKTAVPFDAQAFINQIQSTATINETEGYVTNVNSLFIQQTMTDYQTQVQNYISQNYPNATVGDVLGKKEIVKQEFSYLMGTLPYRTIVKGATYASIPDTLRHKLNFNVIKDIYDSELGTPINITKSLPELAGKKITLSYSPATAQDEAVINSYLPKPHADGTPIQPNELPSSLPSYLINLKPELRVDGVVIATGTPVTMGSTETFNMTFTAPKQSADVITNPIEAGEYLGIALDLGRISQEQMTALKTKLEATKAKLEVQDFSNMTKEDILGDLLFTMALSYYGELDFIDHIAEKAKGVKAIRLPSEAIFSLELKVNSFFGVPLSASQGGLAMDVDRTMSLVKAFDGNSNKPKEYFQSSGLNGSVLEHSVPEQLFSTQQNPMNAISAVKALQIANDQGIPVYTINQSNINYVLPQLQLDGETISDIQNAVNAGKEVTVSKTDISFNGWTGCGYIIIDPVTGAGAYMISGGMSGAFVIGVIAAHFFVLTIIMAVSSITLGGPAGIAAAAVAFGFFAIAMTAFYYEIAYLVGKEKADAFFTCLLKLILGHTFTEFLIDRVGGLLLGNLLTLLSMTVTVGIEFPHCMEVLRE